MNPDDVGSYATTASQTTGGDDDIGSGPTAPQSPPTSGGFPWPKTKPLSPWGYGPGGFFPPWRTLPAEAAETTEEVAGDPVSGESYEGLGESEEVVSGTESVGETAEATPEQLATESGEESAVSDLRGIEGFEEASGSESSTVEVALTEAGTEIGGVENAEFLPFLASLVPMLASTVGPKIGKAIFSRLSTRAKKVLQRVPPPGSGATRVPPGSTAALLSQIALLLKRMGVRIESTESYETGESLEAAEEGICSEAVAVLESIIGNDDRVRIQNTAAIPWRRICALRITFRTGAVYRGTGFLIGPRAIATAGHCVYLHGQGGWARQIEVSPGANGSARPYGSAVATQFRSTAGWVNNRTPESDYGCIVLPPGSFGGKNLGQFAVGVLSPTELVAKPAVLAGYPGDKPFAELWGMARKIKTVNAATLVYDIDTMGGQSGAPVYIKRNGARTVVGIHNYGSTGGNSATRVTSSVFKRLSAWSKL